MNLILRAGFAAALCASLAACGSSDTTPAPTPAPVVTAPEVAPAPMPMVRHVRRHTVVRHAVVVRHGHVTRVTTTATTVVTTGCTRKLAIAGAALHGASMHNLHSQWSNHCHGIIRHR